MIESETCQRFKAQDINLPPFLEMDASLKLQSRYFNQITQVFEPFVEPWSLNAFIQQKVDKGLFDVKINSSHLLNVNVTYAMALCLQTISFEIMGILQAINTQMAKEEKPEHKNIDLRKATNLSASVHHRSDPSFMGSMQF